jgi:hypothetical protein
MAMSWGVNQIADERERERDNEIGYQWLDGAMPCWKSRKWISSNSCAI